jgi:hypothetical protein
MFALVLVLLAVLAVVHSFTPAEKVILDHVKQYKRYTRDNLCTANKCCTISDTESCSLAGMTKDQSILVLPGGETRCIFSTSTPFAFQVIPGASDKLLFYFQGGGACWDEYSTKLGMCTTDVSPQSLVGIFDRTSPNNEFRDYTIVFVSYCSGDVHGGDTVRPYTDSAGVPVTQKGVANTQSALDWVKKQVSAGLLANQFTDLAIMGCSAGSLGAQIWARQVLNQLSWKNAAVVPDSYAGIFPDGTMGPLISSFGFCNTELAFPDIKDQCVAQTLTLMDIDRATMNAIKSVPFTFIQSKTDIVQQSFYVSVGVSMNSTQKAITPAEFYSDVTKVFGTYSQEHENFLTYLIDGDQHCFTPYATVYYTATGAGPKGITSGKAEVTTNLNLYQWTNTLPLVEGASQTTQCDGDVLQQSMAAGIEKSGSDTTYCASTIVPKTFVEHY